MSSKTKAALIVAAAFVAGVFIGVAGDRLALIRSGRLFPRRAAEFATRHVVDHLDRELHLTAQQRTSIKKIVDQHHAHITATWDGVRKQIRADVDAANGEIESVLTPEQKTKFREMRARGEKRRRRPGWF